MPTLFMMCFLLCIPSAMADELACSDDALVGRISFGYRHAVQFNGEYGYAIGALVGLSVYDVSDPIHPTEVANIPFYGGTLLAHHEDLLAVGDDTYLPVQLVDISDPMSPRVVSGIDLYPRSVGFAGDTLFIVTHEYMSFF